MDSSELQSLSHLSNPVNLFTNDLDNGCDWSYTQKRQMQEIIPGLFLGPYASAIPRNKHDLINAGITHIVCIRKSDECRLIREHFLNEFTYKTVELDAKYIQSIIPLLKQVNQFIDTALRQNGKVLVHGLNGSSYSPVFVIAYIIARTDVDADMALKYVANRRFCVWPPDDMRRQLADFVAIARANVQPMDIEMKDTVKRKIEESNDESVKRIFTG